MSARGVCDDPAVPGKPQPCAAAPRQCDLVCLSSFSSYSPPSSRFGSLLIPAHPSRLPNVRDGGGSIRCRVWGGRAGHYPWNRLADGPAEKTARIPARGVRFKSWGTGHSARPTRPSISPLPPSVRVGPIESSSQLGTSRSRDKGRDGLLQRCTGSGRVCADGIMMLPMHSAGRCCKVCAALSPAAMTGEG